MCYHVTMCYHVIQGVLLWSAPLIFVLNGQNVAVLLMDTQVHIGHQSLCLVA